MTTETKRNQTDAGRKKAAMRAYIDAQAKAQKALVSFHTALDRYNDATGAEETARKECEACGCPVGPRPIRLVVTEECPEAKP